MPKKPNNSLRKRTRPAYKLRTDPPVRCARCKEPYSVKETGRAYCASCVTALAGSH